MWWVGVRIRMGRGLIILNTKESLHIKSKPPMKPRTLQKVCGGGCWWVVGSGWWWWWLRVILVLSFKPSLTICFPTKIIPEGIHFNTINPVVTDFTH